MLRETVPEAPSLFMPRLMSQPLTLKMMPRAKKATKAICIQGACLSVMPTRKSGIIAMTEAIRTFLHTPVLSSITCADASR